MKGKKGMMKAGMFAFLGKMIGKAMMGDDWSGDDWSWGDDSWGSDSGKGEFFGKGEWSDNYKGDLNTAYKRSLKGKDAAEEKIVYEVSDVEGKFGYFQGTVTVAGKTITGEPASGKKNAEQMAAKAALEQLFPHMVGNSAQGRQKRSWKQDPANVANKDVLISKVCLLLGRPATKEDIVWSVEVNQNVEGKAPKHVGSVTIAEKGQTFTGTPQWSHKEAENDAAKVAIEALWDEIIPLEEEQKAKRKKKNEESLAKLKASQAEKKAQRAAAAAEKKED